jgi:chemotaxis protein histidine kinase CheA
MPNDDLSQYKDLYIKTANEYIAKINKSISFLSDPAQLAGAVDELYIAIHSLKGQSNVMGYETAGTLCADVQEKLRIIKETKNYDEIESLLEPIEKIKLAIADIEMGKAI